MITEYLQFGSNAKLLRQVCADFVYILKVASGDTSGILKNQNGDKLECILVVMMMVILVQTATTSNIIRATTKNSKRKPTLMSTRPLTYL